MTAKALKAKNIIFKGLIFLMGLLSMNAIASSSFKCPVESIQELNDKAAIRLSIREKFQLKKERIKLYYTISEQIYASFADESLDQDELSLCLASINDQSFKHIASAHIRNEFISSLGRTQSPLLKTLLDDVYTSNSSVIISFHLDMEEDSNKRVASYHRTTKSIQLSLFRTSFNEAKLYLVHELVHKLDENALFRASLDYSNIKVQKKLWSLAQDHEHPGQLENADRNLLEQYLLNGLNRGLLAEFKAWSLSYRIYQEMMDHKEVEPIFWAERVLNKKLKNQSYLDFIFSYYQANFTKPKRNENNLFHWDLVRSAYDEFIHKVERSDKCLYLDDLKEYFVECRY